MKVAENGARIRLDPESTKPGLAELVADPARAEELSASEALALLAQLSALTPLLLARCHTGRTSEDRLVSVVEGAKRLGVEPDWIYRHAASLPFVMRLGGRALRCSTRGLDAYLSRMPGRRP